MAPRSTSTKLEKHKDTLLVLTKAKPKLIKRIISTAPKSLIHALAECALNILHGRVPLTPFQKDKLSKFKNKLRSLTVKRLSLENKKKVLQTGGFVGLLASLIAPLIFEGIGTLVKHIKNKIKKKKHG